MSQVLQPSDAPAPSPARLPPVLAAAARHLPLLRGVAETVRQPLLAHAEARTVRRHQLVLEQGTHGDCVLLLMSGQAVSFRSDERGREVALALLKPGDLLGDLHLIDGLPHSSSVRCLQDSLLLAVPIPDLAVSMARSPELSGNLMAGLVARLRQSHRHVATLSLFEVRSRVRRQLLELAEHRGGGRVVPAGVTRHLLSRMVGASREMVCRVMADMIEQGEVEQTSSGEVWLRFIEPGFDPRLV